MKKEKILKFIKIISLSAVAVVIIAIAGVGSYAAISGDTRIFKSIGIMLEGEEQSIEVVENNTEFESGVSYTIDHSDAFTVTKQDNMDIYTSDGIETISGTLYISMKIYSIDDSKCEELRNELDVEMDKMNALFKKMGYDGNECSEEVTIGKGNYKAIYYRLADGNNWDSTIRNVYIIKVGNKQNLIIETSYFLEAAEGYGDTFRQLLSTLEIKNYKPDEISNNNENKDSQKNDTKVDKNEETNKDSWKRHKSSLGYSMCYDSELMDVNVVNSYTIYDYWKGDEEHYTLKEDKSSIKSPKVVVKRVDENINYNEYFEKLKSEHIYVEDKEEADIEVKKGKTTPITWKTSVNGIEAFVTRLYSPEFHSYSDQVSIKVGDKLGYLVDMSYVGGDSDENKINEMVNSFRIEAN